MDKEGIEKYDLFKNKYLQQTITNVTEESLELLEEHCKRQIRREAGRIVREHEIVLELICRYKEQQKKLEQKESILDKVTEFTTKIVQKNAEKYNSKNQREVDFSEWNLALEILNIIEGEKNDGR